jgi:CubicO group peptidase (beta-lactamase class C family)
MVLSPVSTEELSVAGRRRLHDALTRHLDSGLVPGVVALVSRDDDVHVEALGTAAVGGSNPMLRDTIFRVTSMTKPITAAAALVLVDEGVLRLDDPVVSVLPELAGRQVLTRIDGPLDDTVPAHRPITLRDLLTFRMGFGVLFAPVESHPILQAEHELELRTLGPPIPPTPHTPDEWMRRLGTLPLMAQPGERWLYNTGTHVLGVLVARVSGRPLATFLRERVFEPLGMVDTGFSVAARDVDRLPPCYRVVPNSGALEIFDSAEGSQWSRPPVFPDGSGGLVSTVDDYLAFGRMLLGEGTYGGERVLSPTAVELMTTNHLSTRHRADAAVLLGDRGWGFGTAVADPGARGADPPGFGWDGGYGTSWACDPATGLVGVLMTQRAETHEPSPVYRDFWASLAAAA